MRTAIEVTCTFFQDGNPLEAVFSGLLEIPVTPAVGDIIRIFDEPLLVRYRRFLCKAVSSDDEYDFVGCSTVVLLCDIVDSETIPRDFGFYRYLFAEKCGWEIGHYEH